MKLSIVAIVVSVLVLIADLLAICIMLRNLSNSDEAASQLVIMRTSKTTLLVLSLTLGLESILYLANLIFFENPFFLLVYVSFVFSIVLFCEKRKVGE